MAYTKTTWTDSDNKYDIKTQADVVLYNDVKLVWDGTTGTPLSATNLNNIEAELEALDANYGTCTTAAATAAKVVTLSGFTLSVKTIFGVTFDNVNTAAAVTLAVNSTAATAVYVGASAATAAQIPKVAYFQYDGAYYQLLNPLPEIIRLYEKIRDIADTSATTTLSLDVSDIDWSTYREIKLIGEITLSTGGNTYVRVNSLSADYKTSGADANNSWSVNASATALDTIFTPSSGVSEFEISIYKNGNGVGSKSEWIDGKNGIGVPYFKLGWYNGSIETLSTINFVSSTAGYTVYLQNASLWGVKR